MTDTAHASHPKAGFWTLALGSIGVVYGDIGTSPLYALRESLNHAAADGLTQEEVVGIVSLLLWSLTLIVTIKYVIFILRADNRGEGGTLSLLALAQEAVGRRTLALFLLGVAGAALFYGDAIITPAISVLSAVEGLELASPGFTNYVLPLTVVILIALFAIQNQGTGSVSAWFGPITLVWFLIMGALGVMHIGDDLSILAALNPIEAIRFVVIHGFGAFTVMGSVFLAVTGAEALYADMGHFGRKPIQFAWIVVVFPALALNYLGQGSMVMAHPETLENPFFLMAPSWGLLPLVGMATVATVIASQAVISGAFSLTQQAIQLGLLPRLEIRHTSEAQVGQIYMPKVNWLLLVGVLFLVFTFRSSSALGNAYGIAVTGTMVSTSLMAFIVFWRAWHWPLWKVSAVIAPLLVVEMVFLTSNMLKLFEGGYVPLFFAAMVGLMMWTWVRGSDLTLAKARAETIPLADLIGMLQRSSAVVSKGTAVFMTSDPEIAPSALMHNLKHNHVIHQNNVVVKVSYATAPHVAEADRITITPLDSSFTQVTVTFGYMDDANLPMALAHARKSGIKFDIMSTSFFLSRRSFKPAAQSAMPHWQNRLYIALTKQATDATSYYRLPSNRVVEIGQQFTI
ncbi:potassium transporter Kup [Oryzibacter oryziterrae]|uniref:potassium transporter Kup n=1 Tax=Oryzibacter oryziterrae TaxID=2766474 RepID=UPI001F222A80|nr:potassium transporter Kup [Oryzibacter oryziterrae]